MVNRKKLFIKSTSIHKARCIITGYSYTTTINLKYTRGKNLDDTLFLISIRHTCKIRLFTPSPFNRIVY